VQRVRWIAGSYALLSVVWLVVVALDLVSAERSTMLGFVALTAVVATTIAVAAAGSSAKDDALGGYRLVEQLSEGGMGEVWRAEHDALIRPAAVKVMRSELLGSLSAKELNALLARFKREVQVTATLSSPHTIDVFDFGETGDGGLYYAMELLHGLDLETLVERHGPQPAERVVHLMKQVCSSLGEAHYRKLIHRDIKPANIYVCVVGIEVDFVKVLDFGLVRDLNVDHRLTLEGSTPGTPSYLAPEFLVDRVDHRSDLYALGCVAYWLLTGQLVFTAETRIAMLAAHNSEQPIAPSKRTELPVPRELDELVLALLAKDPAHRPQSAGDVAARLDAIPLAEPWTPRRAESWWQTNLPAILGKGRYGTEPVRARAA
jgi:serine/threonine protein kinase